MPKDLFAQFPRLTSDTLLLRKMEPCDADDLFAIYRNPALFRYTPGSPRKTKEAVSNMIGHFQRDFGKRKTVILGICLTSAPDHLVGVAEMFDYNKKANMITIGYRLHEDYWSRGIATKAVRMMADYLFEAIAINRIQAFVMPENQKSHAVLLRCGFVKEVPSGRELYGRARAS